MNRTLSFFLLLGIVSSLHGQSSCDRDSQQCSPNQPTNVQNVYEILTPAIGENTRVYTLHAVPSPHGGVHLFLARTELKQGTDYTIEGRFVTIASTAADKGEEELRAEYSVDTSPEASGKVLEAQRSASESRELLNRYLERALDRSSVSSSTNDGTDSSSDAGTDLHRRGQPARHTYAEQPASLRMLSASVVHAAASREQHETGGGRKVRTRITTAATDGIGDQIISSPFDLLAASPEGLEKSLDYLHMTDDHKARSIKPLRDFVPRSLVMLQDRVSNHQ